MNMIRSELQKDEQAVLDGFNNANAQIDPDFKAALREKFVHKATTPASSLGWMMGFWPVLAGSALGVTLSLVVLFGLNTAPVNPVNVPNKQHVINNLLSKNSSGLLNSAINADNLDLGTLPVENLIPSETVVTPPTSSPSTLSNSRNTTSAAASQATIKANYSFVRAKWTAGNTVCGAQFPYSADNAVNELYAYKSSHGQYLKSISYSNTNQLTNYELRTPTQVIVYRGGKYGVTLDIDSTPEESSGSSTTTSIEALVSNMPELPNIAGAATGGLPTLDADIEIEGTQTVDGKSYIVVRWVSDVECEVELPEISTSVARSSEESALEELGNESTSSVSTSSATSSAGAVSHKVHNRLWLDEETYVIAKQEKYLDEVSQANLLGTVVYEIQADVVEDEEAEPLFRFEHNVSLRNITPMLGENSENESLSTYINSQELKVLKPADDASWILQRVDIPSLRTANGANKSYVYDRDFYPDGELGDRIWAPYHELIPAQLPLLSWNFRAEEKESEFVLYASRMPFKQYSEANADWIKYKDIIATKINVKVGNSLPAADMQYSPMPPKDAEITNPAEFIPYCIQAGITDCTHRYLITFEYENRFYAVEISYVGTPEEINDLLDFDTLSSVEISRLR